MYDNQTWRLDSDMLNAAKLHGGIYIHISFSSSEYFMCSSLNMQIAMGTFLTTLHAIDFETLKKSQAADMETC